MLHAGCQLALSPFVLDPDRRSVSTMNLSKHVDPVISKRLSSSSATLLNSPDRGTVQRKTTKVFCYLLNAFFSGCLQIKNKHLKLLSLRFLNRKKKTSE